MATQGYEAGTEDASVARKTEELAPLVPSEEHESFALDKKHDDDQTIGLPNNRHILCQFCEIILIPENNATKVRLECDMIEGTLREYQRINAYWHVDELIKFQNIEIHQQDSGMKYLCCLSCQSAILGYQVIAEPHLIYIACDRVKEEI